ncbi:lactadherin-like [Asterias amurensis]|uniref:lactadherin-like n=1 Tax=Asterias amurensis TaxID=7602 RepID=UPI003AB76702
MITFHHINHVLNPLILKISFFLIASNCIAESCQMSYYGPVPEPDPGQPYNKYYWVKSAMEKLRSGRLKGAIISFLFTHVCSAEFDGPLGMENGDILDSDLSSSTMAGTYYRASQARLNNQGAWCAYLYDLTPWIQVNFKANVSITGLITQGMHNANRHVMTFRVQYGDSTSSLTDVTTSSGVQLFTGNSDADSHVTNRFSPVLHAQYLRIVPVSWVSGNKCCMRFEVLGCR